MRLFIPPALLAPGELTVAGGEHHYLARVRRARPGDPVELVDGAGGRADAQVVTIADDHSILRVGAPEHVSSRPPRVRCLVPLIKGDRMELGLEKLVEVGVDEIVVWPAARSVVKLEDDRRDVRIAKYVSVVQAAARQSGRAQLPILTWAPTLPAALAGLPPGRRLVLDPCSDAPLSVADPSHVTVVSGPEGGLAPEELDLLGEFDPVGLGPRILRAETAPVVAVALIRAATRS